MDRGTWKATGYRVVKFDTTELLSLFLQCSSSRLVEIIMTTSRDFPQRT